MLSLFVTLTAVLFAALVVTAAARDALSFTIPNWISGGLILLFFPAAQAGGLGWPAFGLHLGVGLAALIAGMAMFALRWMGGGDAKLLAAAALWLGWPAVLTFVGAAAIAGGALALVLIALRTTALRPFVLLGPPWVVRLAEPGEAVPYGVAIALGALVALPGSPLAGGLAL